MTKPHGSNLLFDEEEVRLTNELLPRLIRVIFFGLGISNDEYTQRFQRHYLNLFPDKSRKEALQRSGSGRNFLMDRRKLTFQMLRSIMSAMGYDIECVSMRVKDQVTGEVKTFSTDQTVEDLKEIIAKEREVPFYPLV